MHKNKYILVAFGFIFSLLLTMPQGLLALPSDPTVESGSASFEQPDPNTLNITADDKAVINFSSFDIALNETVNFFQPTSTSTVLSRITGLNGTSIWGGLNANGILFLVNPNGIYFAQSAQVNAAGLVASTLDISTNNFLAGNYIFEHSANSPFAQVSNEGSITADNVALIGSSANNSGVIVATAGTVHLASGDKTTVSFDARGLIQVEVNEETSGNVYDLNGVSVKDAVANSGSIEAAHVVMTTQTASDIFESAVNTTGVVRATGFVQEGGTIRITANKDIKVSGTLEAQNNGTITVESTQGNVAVPLSLTLIGTTALNSIEKDILIQASIVHSGGSLALYAPLGNITNSSGAPIRGPDVSLKAQNIDTQVDSPVISVWRNADNLHLTRSSQEDGFVTLEGDGLSLVYPVTTALTLKSNNTITTEPGVVLQAKSIRIEANKFGTIENPLYLLADTTYLNRLAGNIDIVYSQVFGSQVLVRGPPEGFGAIIYSANTSLTLEAPNGSISLASNTTLASTSGSVTLKTNKGNIDVFGTITAPEGDVTLWTCGNIDVRQATIISKNGGFIYNPDDTISVSWIGGSGNSWGTGANWSGGNVPNDANYVVTIDLASAAVTTSTTYTIGSLTIGGTQTCSLTLGGNLTLDTSLGATGNLTIGTGGTLSAGSYTITVPGNWDSSTGTFTNGTSTVKMTGTSNNLTTASNFYKLTIDTGAVITAQSSFGVASGGTLIISGTLNVAASKVLILSNANFTLNAGGVLSGSGTFRQRVNSVTTPARVVILDGTISIATYIFDLFNSDGGAPGVPITAANYQGDLTILTTGNTTINYTYITGGNLTVGGTLTIKTGLTYSNFTVILDNSQENRNITAGALVVGDSGYTSQYSQLIAGSGTITINGNVTIYASDASGTNSITAGSSTWYVSGNWTNNDTFTANTSTVTFNGTSTQAITPNAQSFNNLTIANTSADVSLAGALTVSGTLTINSNATLSLAGQGLTVSTTLTNNGTLKLRGSESVSIPGSAPQSIGGTVTYTGDGDSAADTYDIKNWSYNNLTINSTDGATDTFRLPTANLTVGGNYALTAGTFTTKDSGTTDRNLSVTGNVTIAGTFTANSSTITVGGNWDSSAGTFTYGTSTVKMTGSSKTFTYKGSWSVPQVYNLTIGDGASVTFVHGAGSIPILIANDIVLGTNASLTLYSHTFMTPNGNSATAGNLTLGTGATLTIPTNANLVRMINDSSPHISTTGTITGAGYFEYFAVSGSTAAPVTARTYDCDLAVNGATASATGVLGGGTSLNLGSKTLYIYDKNGNFGFYGTLNTNNLSITAGALVIGDPNTFYGKLICGSSTIDINGNVTIYNGSGNNSITANTSTWYVGGNWTNNDTFTAGSSTVDFNKSSGFQDITNNYQNFYNLAHSGASTMRPIDDLSVTGTFTNSSGTIDFQNSGTGLTVTGLATVSGGSLAISSYGGGTGASFNGGLTISGGTITGPSSTAGTIDVNGNLTFSIGTVTANKANFNISGNLSISSGATWTKGTGTLTFDGTTQNASDANATPNDLGAVATSGTTTVTMTDDLTVSSLNIGNGTTFNLGAGSYTLTLTGTGTPLTINSSGAFNKGTGSTVVYTNSTSATVAAVNYQNLTLTPASGTPTYTLGTGTTTVSGALTNNASSTLAIGANTLSVTGNAANSGTITISTGTLDIDGNFTVGTLTATGAAAINIVGNWSGVTSFTPSTSTVTFSGTGTSVISGSTTFYNLASITAGKTLSLTRGTTQTITHDLTLTGTSGNPIVLNDTGAGAVPKLTLQAGATQNLDNVTVTNNDASLGLALVAKGTGSTLNGTTTNWILSANGTVYTWTGTVSGDWNNAANWDLGLVPSSTDTVVIPSGTPFEPVLGGSETLTELTVQEGGSVSTGGQPLTVTGDVALNGTLNAGSSTITISGDLTGSSTGILEGEDVILAVNGSVGSLGSPVITSVSGTLTISASQMQDNVSVSISGSGNYSFSNSIPGFVFVNGGLSPHVGQAAIRSSLEQGESNLYNSMPAMPQSLLTPPPLNLISMLATPMGPAPVAIPITMPQVPVVLPRASFEGAQGSQALPESITPEVFEGIATTSQAKQPENFSGVTSEAAVPQDITESFTGILPSAQTSTPLTKETFLGANTQDLLPTSVDSMFEGVTSTIRMTTSPISFEELSDSANIKVAFPEGQKVIPTYDLGIPLGAEKPILETKIEAGIKGRR
ncbi:MAG: filamentous hemagglutinin N-terminal domain-containing protein [Candidatus Omnitrophica bacterium]|nr:filamentous hemagglutinin N-terminal domain-containing protein [Candidatus Omnitrophota bacterium]